MHNEYIKCETFSSTTTPNTKDPPVVRKCRPYCICNKDNICLDYCHPRSREDGKDVIFVKSDRREYIKYLIGKEISL